MTRLLHLGDTQIGVGGPGRLDDQRAVLARVAHLALERQVDGVIHGGDVFEGPAITPEQLEVFAEFVAELRTAGIPMLAVSGNGRHDLAMRAPTALGIFDHIPGVMIATRPDVFLVGGAAVAALPWVHIGRRVASNDGGDRALIHDEVVSLLLRIAEGLREDCAVAAPDAPAVLVPHWAISGAGLPSGIAVDEMNEPILPLDAFLALGFDLIAASHIHVPQVVLPNGDGTASPWLPPSPASARRSEPGGPLWSTVHQGALALYTGSPQPHNHGEASYEHGVWIVECDALAKSAEFVPIESRSFVTLDLGQIGTTPLTSLEVPDGAIVRVKYTATPEEARRFDAAELQQALRLAGASEVTLQPKIERAQVARIATLDDTLTETAALDLFLAEHEDLAPLADRMRVSASRYMAAVSR